MAILFYSLLLPGIQVKLFFHCPYIITVNNFSSAINIRPPVFSTGHKYFSFENAGCYSTPRASGRSLCFPFFTIITYLYLTFKPALPVATPKPYLLIKTMTAEPLMVSPLTSSFVSSIQLIPSAEDHTSLWII